MKVSAQYAETHFSQLISAAYSGEEVRIASPDKPGLRLVVEERVEEVARPVRRRDLFGAWEGKIVLPTDEEWQAMDKEIEDEMVNGLIFPLERA